MNHHLAMTLRFPAEWEPQDAVLLAWPHEQTDWQPILQQVTRVYIELVRQISRFEAVIVITPQPKSVQTLLTDQQIDLTQIFIVSIETNDTWVRDFGPITIFSNNRPVFLDFTFNGWGGKFSAEKDNRATKQLTQIAALQSCRYKEIALTLEGGSIESDGAGTLLTTSACLLNPNRNPHLDKNKLTAELKKHLGCDHILWLDHGWLAGDDTDSHIDTLARLCPNNTIVYVRCDDKEDQHYTELKLMEQQLQEFTTKTGAPYQLISLPWPQAHFAEGERLPATYANFLVINEAVLVPTYDDPADKQALTTISQVFPDRDIIGIDCQTLIKQRGSLHCITMQLSQGVLSWTH